VQVLTPSRAGQGFAALLDRIEGNGVRTVIVEDASRFARELITQELGILALINRGVRVLTASGDDLTDSSDPSRVMMRQIAGAFHQYEKARLVAKLRAARQRKREKVGKVEGRKIFLASSQSGRARPYHRTNGQPTESLRTHQWSLTPTHCGRRHARQDKSATQLSDGSVWLFCAVTSGPCCRLYYQASRASLSRLTTAADIGLTQKRPWIRFSACPPPTQLAE
jgi:hypothetical protein